MIIMAARNKERNHKAFDEIKNLYPECNLKRM